MNANPQKNDEKNLFQEINQVNTFFPPHSSKGAFRRGRGIFFDRFNYSILLNVSFLYNKRFPFAWGHTVQLFKKSGI
jgi:hypothetical protein